MPHPMHTRLFAAALLALCQCASGKPDSTEVEGIRVSWQYRPLSDAAQDHGLGTLEIQLEDSTTHQPLRYGRGQLAAWLRPERHALSDSELSCTDQVRNMSGQKITGGSEIDLNSWRLLTFNSDRTLAFINPFVGINNAKLESILTLPGDIDNWAPQLHRFQLWVHTRDGGQSRISLVDTQRRAITASLDAPPGPAALAADPDGRGLWIVAPNTQQVGWLDSEHPGQPTRWASAPAVVGGIGGESEGIYAWHNGTEPAVRLWRTASSGAPEIKQQWAMPAPVLTVRWSQQARRLIVALSDGRLVWVNPQSSNREPERVLRIGGDGIRLSSIELFDGGRRLLWLDSASARAGSVDVATARELTATGVTDAADTIVVTDDFAYFHSTRHGRATLLSLSDLRSGHAQPVEITTGRPSPDALPGLRVAPEPGGQGVLIANPADGVVYQYAEGMMAPAGSYSNYRRSAMGIMVLDTALTEAAPGSYQATLRSERAGRHTLILGGISPRLAACLSINIPGAVDRATATASSPAISAELESVTVSVIDSPLTRDVRVRLAQPGEAGEKAVTGVKDLTLLVFERRTAWQQRIRMQEASPGLYATTVTLPHQGKFDWLVSSGSQGLAFREARPASQTREMPR